MAGYIPKEQLDAYRHWQLDSFDPPKPEQPPPPPVSEAPAFDTGSEVIGNFGLPTAEDIEQMHDQARQEGYRAGFEEGHQAGLQAGLEEARAQVERLASLADNATAALNSIDQTVADQLLALALEAARQMVRATLAVRPESILPVVREAIAALPMHHGHIMLHINAADAELVREHLGEQFAQSGWRIVEDREIQAGGCFIRAGSSEIDATVETRWRRLLEAIGANPGAWNETP